MNTFFENVITVLKQDQRFFAEDGTFLRNAVYEAAMQMDGELIRVLLSNEETKQRFFKDIDGVLVFDKIEFGWVINNRQFLPDSYTRYKNKIGLVTESDEWISSTGKVDLVFPYKDCVLEGGQTKEDQKRGEVFFNTILAPDEIDRLLSPKVLTNAARITKTNKTKDYSFDITDNIVIKGNNLLAISSLLQTYENQIKLIYIDPPYNTGGAANTFAYNNSFNHSTWLTFMKNRIEIAKKLLRQDGAICIAIDDEEYAHLKILCDEIFGRENYIGTIVVQSNPRGRTINSQFATCHEYALYYAKNINLVVVNNQELSEEQEEEFGKTDDEGKYRLLPFRRSGGTSTPEERPNSEFSLLYSPEDNNIIAVGGERTGDASTEYSPKYILQLDCNGEIISKDPEEFYAEFPSIIPILPVDILGKRRVWRWSDREAVLKAAANNDFVITENDSKYIVRLKDRIKDGRKPKTIWSDSRYDASANGTILLKKIFKGEKLFSYPKSLYTVKDTIKMLTDSNSGDIVLDFFAGSGTTAHAILELNKEDDGNRQFILCEQMNYIETVTIPRIQAIMDEKDSFVYCELAKLNQVLVEDVEAADEGELLRLYEKIIQCGYISYRVNLSEIDAAADDYSLLSLSDKKRLLIEILDKNMLYVNYCDIDDEEYRISEDDKSFTRRFYGEE